MHWEWRSECLNKYLNFSKGDLENPSKIESLFWIIFKGSFYILLKTNSQRTVIIAELFCHLPFTTDKGLEIPTGAKEVCATKSQKKKWSKRLGSKIYHYYSKCHQQEGALKINTLLIVAHKLVICEVWLQSAFVAKHIVSYGSKLFTLFLSIETFAFKATLGCCYCSK